MFERTAVYYLWKITFTGPSLGGASLADNAGVKCGTLECGVDAIVIVSMVTMFYCLRISAAESPFKHNRSTRLNSFEPSSRNK